ncbi:hypothetical protein LCGC14_2869540, partial [marine sediment metagenome]
MYNYRSSDYDAAVIEFSKRDFDYIK